MQSGPPALDGSWVRRRAKLFEAGEYPDKGVTIDAERLGRLRAAFSSPVPLLIEHATSPLELGYLIEVDAAGKELFGTIALTPEANALIERSGAFSLSIGLSADLDRIEEVSVVRVPRVADARLFAGRLEVADGPAREDRDRVERAIREGRLAPAQGPLALALLGSEGSVRFGAGETSIRGLFAAFLEGLPRHGLFSELAVASRATSEDLSNLLLMPEEAEFYRRHFPDVALEEIARRKRS
jgi:hypothetical protein